MLYCDPGVTAVKQLLSLPRCVRTSLRSPPVHLETATRSATTPEWASLVWDQTAELLATLAPACWKHTGSEAGVLALRSCSRDAFCTRLPEVGGLGAGAGTNPPVASGRMEAVLQRWLVFM